MQASASRRGCALRWLVGSVVLACSPAATLAPAGADPAGDPAVKSSARTEEATATATGCADAACWLRMAEESAGRGDEDVAASHRGAAFRREPTAARLGVWIDALVAGGAFRRAREGLAEAQALAERRGDRALAVEVTRRLAGLPAIREGSIEPPALSDALRAAYAAETAGRHEDAAAGLAAAHAGEPVHLARAGDAAMRRGDAVAARRLWSAARTELHERGAAVELVAVRTWHTTTAAWRGDELAVMKLYSSLEALQDNLGGLQVRAAGAAWRSLYFARPAMAVGFSEDGQWLVRDEDGALVVQDTLSGTSVRTLATPGGRVTKLVTSGSGDALLVLACGEAGTGLWDARGRQVATFELTGTTPTITRVYTGEGSYHENHLHDSPTWPVALAMTAGAGLVAVGGSDSKVRVFDGAGKLLRVLAHKWDYTERRHMGANPDLNLPLALRFDAQERLVGVYQRGDIFVWAPRTGELLQRHLGRCSAAEATDDVNRYNEPGAPRREPTSEELASCGSAAIGDIDPSGATVVTGGSLSGFRVRSVATGRSLKYVARGDLPDHNLALSRSGALGMADLYGATAVWRPGAADVERWTSAGESSPISPRVSFDGARVHWSVGRRDHFWDLASGRRLAVTQGPKEDVLAVDGDLRRAAVRTPDAIEVREVATGRELFRRVVAGKSAYALAAAGGLVVFHLSDGTASLEVVVVAADGTSTTLVMTGDTPTAVSDDGRWLATTAWQGRVPVTKVWSLRAAGRVVHTLDGVRQVAFSRDGSRMVFLRTPDPQRAEVVVREQAVEGAADVREVTLEGWSEQVSFTPDGSEVLVLLQSGRFVRWRPASGERREWGQVSLILTKGVQVADDGRTVLFPGWDHVQIRSNDAALRRIATLYPLLAGGWLVVSRSGAVDGSDDAVDSVLTRATQGGATRVFDGRLGWDGARVAGTLARALAGEDVRPPVLVRPPSPPEEPLKP